MLTSTYSVRPRAVFAVESRVELIKEALFSVDSDMQLARELRS